MISLMFSLSCVRYAFVCVCLFVPCDHLLGKADLLALVCGVSLRVCHFPIGILGQVWCLIVSIPDLCTLTYFTKMFPMVPSGVNGWSPVNKMATRD